MKSEIQNTDQGSTFKATAHLFEYTTTFGLDANLHFRYPEKGVVPTQILLCIKETNQRKINSHRWFFNAFAPLLQVSVFQVQHLVHTNLNAAQRLHSFGRWHTTRP